jgi:lysophosphatidate acyltransferase
MLGTIFPKWCSVTAKSSLKWTPILGWFMALSNTVFIDRKHRATAMKAFEGAAKHMRNERQSVYIFPEGTRSYYEKPDLLPFKKGAFHLAIQAQVPIVPIVVANYSNVLNIKRRIFRPGRIPIKVLPPVSTKGLDANDVHRLCDDMRADMLKAIIGLTTSERAQGRSTTVADGGASTGVDFGKRPVANSL